MIEIKFINFTKLCREDLLFILKKRNSSSIRSLMVNTNIISEQEHFKFCESLKSDKTKLYFLMLFNNEKIGVFDYCNINNQDHTYEPGCYFFDNFDQKYRADVVGSSVNLRKIFKLYFPTIRVKKSNIQALLFNTMKMKCQIIKSDNDFYYLKPSNEPTDEKSLLSYFQDSYEYLCNNYDIEYVI